MWMFICGTPLWFVASELFLQYWADEDAYRYQRPPPYNYPNPEATPDDETNELFKSVEYRALWEAGVVKDPYLIIYLDSSKLKTVKRSIRNGLVSTTLYNIQVYCPVDKK
jgi:hypothetical protein